jgi:predicted esterase
MRERIVLMALIFIQAMSLSFSIRGDDVFKSFGSFDEKSTIKAAPTNVPNGAKTTKVRQTKPVTPIPAWAGDHGAVFKSLPSQILPHKKYLFYLVGDVGEGMTAQEFSRISEEFVKLGFLVICNPVRNSNYTKRYIDGISTEVKSLLSAGVPAKNIILLGYSSGGMVALQIATELNNPGLNYVIIAGVPKKSGRVRFPQDVKIDPVGMIWNIYGKKDRDFGSLREFMSSEAISLRALCRETRVDKGHEIGRSPDKNWMSVVNQLATQ